jgi:hypothetical protein
MVILDSLDLIQKLIWSLRLSDVRHLPKVGSYIHLQANCLYYALVSASRRIMCRLRPLFGIKRFYKRFWRAGCAITEIFLFNHPVSALKLFSAGSSSEDWRAGRGKSMTPLSASAKATRTDVKHVGNPVSNDRKKANVFAPGFLLRK